MELNLVKITDTSGKSTGIVGDVRYQALTDQEEDDILQVESDYSYIGRDFTVEMLGNVYIPSLDKDEGF